MAGSNYYTKCDMATLKQSKWLRKMQSTNKRVMMPVEWNFSLIITIDFFAGAFGGGIDCVTVVPSENTNSMTKRVFF